jgi:hypothetical protein
MGVSVRHWIVMYVLVPVGVLVPWFARRDTDAARGARRQERKRRLREMGEPREEVTSWFVRRQ